MKTSTTPASSLEANEVWKLAKKKPKNWLFTEENRTCCEKRTTTTITIIKQKRKVFLMFILSS